MRERRPGQPVVPPACSAGVTSPCRERRTRARLMPPPSTPTPSAADSLANELSDVATAARSLAKLADQAGVPGGSSAKLAIRAGGLQPIAEPLTASLHDALLCLVVHVHDAEAAAVTKGPFEIVEQAPGEISA